ncbi:hypothetical protein K0M31_016580 [Melipona bicolor]|uniref:Uncharacterized protein n=1 Tax=Melipona bicolor TaxID=60889 RepID=A0AA40FEI1_9HYME|nr:hypothetical protein K0M31_016580 [Melipona bicolor]
MNSIDATTESPLKGCQRTLPRCNLASSVKEVQAGEQEVAERKSVSGKDQVGNIDCSLPSEGTMLRKKTLVRANVLDKKWSTSHRLLLENCSNLANKVFVSWELKDFSRDLRVC